MIITQFHVAGNTCSYRALTDPKSITEGWKVGHGRIGNALTGIPADSSGSLHGKFAYVGYLSPDALRQTQVDHSAAIFTLESQSFTLKKPANLHYDVFLRSAFPELMVCVNTQNTCIKSYKLRDVHTASDKWWHQRETIALSPGTHKVLFVARNVSGNQYVAIDNIELDPKSALC
ncbi:unnamed protein product [Soboliphyme baturini]|uniref:MAM domain-containing protein n=1 Tax=Soboliphyme baturini TaxID=241478 RepID=A0A183J3V2_9BILA|nr:unnamed protein product [Soboliphyme baturini]